MTSIVIAILLSQAAPKAEPFDVPPTKGQYVPTRPAGMPALPASPGMSKETCTDTTRTLVHSEDGVGHCYDLQEIGQVIQPTRDRVLVKADPPPKKVGSIHLPEFLQTNKTPMMDGLKAIPGVVVAVGPGFYDEDGDFVPTTVKPGDKVWVSSRWNDMPEYSETERLVQEADILGWRT